MNFFTALTEAIASHQSLLVTGLDPNPEMLRSWALSRQLGGSSPLSQARATDCARPFLLDNVQLAPRRAASEHRLGGCCKPVFLGPL